MKRLFFLIIFLTFYSSLFAQGSICAVADPFCSSDTFIFPSTINIIQAEPGPNYGCLGTTPNPSWYYLGIGASGDIVLQISQVNNAGIGMDVDFICYGPFSDQFTPCTALLTGGCNGGHNCGGNIVDCSYEPDPVETLTIPNAQVGEFYIVLITNYGEQAGFITLQQTNVGQNGAGETDCSIVCTVEIPNDKTFCVDTPYTITSTLGNGGMTASATYQWYKNNIPLVGATNSTLTVNSLIETTDTYKLIVNADNCDDPAIDEIIINYVDAANLLPAINDLYFCDTTNSGATTAEFDLTQQETEIFSTILNSEDYTITYYTDAGLTTLITNPTNYTNTTAIQAVYIKIENNSVSTCFDSESFNIQVIEAYATTPNDIDICDDDLDGFLEFNLSVWNLQVIGTFSLADYNISYHLNQNDANNNINELPLLFTNTISFQQEIIIRVENKLNTDCYHTTVGVLNVRPFPILNSPVNYVQCDDENIVTDGIAHVDLSEINQVVIGLNQQELDDLNMTFIYYPDFNSATNNINAITNFDNFLVDNNEQLYVRATTEYGCSDIAEVNISVSTSQIPANYLLPNADPLLANPLIVEEFIQCDDLQDDDDDTNGINTFNLGASIIFLRNLFPTEQNLIITFFESLDDAILENNAIDTFHYRNKVPVGHDMSLPVTQDIWVRVDNVLNDTCIGVGKHIKLTVNPLPVFEIQGANTILCIGETNTLTSNFNNTSGDYTFSWTFEDLETGSEFLSNEEFLDITKGGTYALTITNTITMCSRTQTVEITESQKPTFNKIEILSFQKPNNQVIVEVTGIGDYEYALENTIFYNQADHRDFQDSNLFEHLNAGEYLVTVRDKNSCGIINTKFIILDYNPFFTPNNDSINDLWTIKGLDLYPNAVVTIFDRHGKVLSQFNAASNGWNGIYKDKVVHDNDYWFTVDYQDYNGENHQYKHHFSVITVKE